MAHGTVVTEIKNPGPHQISGKSRTILMVLAAIGVLTFAGGLAFDAKRTWSGFLVNHFYFMSLALGGLFFAAIQWITGAMWSSPIRRIAESFTSYLPVALVMFIILYFGMHSLFPWTHPEIVKGDIILEGKAGYLNVPFFMIRNIVAIGLWIFFTKKLVGNSIAQDISRDPQLTIKNKQLTPAFLLIFGLTYTMASFDLLMSLDPHWFSTMFGVYTFSGLFYSTLALTAVLAAVLKKDGRLDGIVNPNHMHDLGKFMFAFAIFWAYIGFSQFMLIWYSNLPEETQYFLHRFQNGWFYVSVFLLVGKFMVPFFALIPRGSKRDDKRLFIVGVFMLIAQWVDIFWLVQPEAFREGPVIGWIEIGLTLGFIGMFGLMVARFLGRNSIVAIGDPLLKEAVFHHHQ
ncbi:MAG: molybdopterin oxidoreductase [Methylotenera sp.]|nr:molybdopterin oxidoreductase [Oligoflexia bacterium]